MLVFLGIVIGIKASEINIIIFEYQAFIEIIYVKTIEFKLLLQHLETILLFAIF